MGTEEIRGATGQDDSLNLVLDCKDVYSYEDDWRQILYLLPELVDRGSGRDSAEHRHQIDEAKEEVGPELENEEDEESKADIREWIHGAWVTGVLWVQDEDTAECGEVLLLWIDEFGRSVRANRLESDEIEYNWGLFHAGGRECDHPWWWEAEVGETYEHGAWPEASSE
jgi:hypothetical protein